MLFSPPERRLEQVRRAEALHDQIDQGATYPLDFVAFRITGYHAEAGADVLLIGEAIKPDLRLVIDALSRSVAVAPGADEPVVSPTDLARQLDISTRTLARWRRLGLRWRWVMLPGRRHPQVVYPRDAVDRFLVGHADLVRRAARFSHMTPQVRQRLIERARRIALARPVTLNQVAAHLARRTGRALETIRQILEKHERRPAGQAIFADRSGPITARDRRVMARAHRRGVSIGAMAAHFGRTRFTIHRALREERAAAIQRVSLRCFRLPTFDRPDADAVFLRAGPAGSAPGPEGEDGDQGRAGNGSGAHLPAVDDLPPPLQPLYRVASPSAEDSRTLLVRMNYLKHRVLVRRQTLDRTQPRGTDLAAIEADLAQVDALGRELADLHRPVVLAAARGHLLGRSDASPDRLLELLLAGQEVLHAAVEAFDINRPGTFDAFLRWHLMRRFASAPTPPPGRAHSRTPSPHLVSRLLNPSRGGGKPNGSSGRSERGGPPPLDADADG